MEPTEITKAEAKRICGGTLPKCGYERLVLIDNVYYWVSNASNAFFTKRLSQGWKLVNGQAVSDYKRP